MAANLEIWKPVVGFEDLYEVSDCGRVRRSTDGCILASSGDKVRGGYVRYRVTLVGNKTKIISRLVLESHVCLPPSDTSIAHHIDGDTSNNKVSNLEWIERDKHISMHRESNGIYLSASDVLEIYNLLFERGLPGVIVAQKFSVSPAQISLVRNGKRYKTMHKQYFSSMRNVNSSKGTAVGSTINNPK